MKNYKGISKLEFPDWRGWDYVESYRSLCRDGDIVEFFNNDKPMQRLVRRHYYKIRLFKVLFNLSVYIAFYIVAILIKG